MAERRMFTKKVTDDDNFQALSASAQALYLHLSMSADDDGFCNQVSVSMFKAHASVQDLQALLEKRYIYQFDNGVIVIKHWRMANALRKDRYTPTAFQEELAHLGLKDNGSYTWLPNGCQTVADRLPQDRLDKDSIDKNNKREIYKEKKPTPIRKQIPPTVEMVEEYCLERGNSIDAEKFCDFYEMKGWMVGKDKMKDWQAAIRTWEKQNGDSQTVKDQALIEKGRKAQEEAERRLEEEHKAEMEQYKKEHPDLWADMEEKAKSLSMADLIKKAVG